MVSEFIPTKRDISSRELFLNNVKQKYIHYSKLPWIKQDRSRKLGLTKSEAGNAQNLTAKNWSNISNMPHWTRMNFFFQSVLSVIINTLYIVQEELNGYIEAMIRGETGLKLQTREGRKSPLESLLLG